MTIPRHLALPSLLLLAAGCLALACDRDREPDEGGADEPSAVRAACDRLGELSKEPMDDAECAQLEAEVIDLCGPLADATFVCMAAAVDGDATFACVMACLEARAPADEVPPAPVLYEPSEDTLPQPAPRRAPASPGADDEAAPSSPDDDAPTATP